MINYQIIKLKKLLVLKNQPSTQVDGIKHQVNPTTEPPAHKNKIQKRTQVVTRKSGKKKAHDEETYHSLFEHPVKDHVTVKTSLKSILKKEQVLPQIHKLVCECHEIMIQTYQFIRLYFLHRYHMVKNNIITGSLKTPPQTLVPSPHELNPDDPDTSTLSFDKTLMTYFITACGRKSKRGHPPDYPILIEEFQTFYETQFSPLIDKREKYSLVGKSQVIQFLGIELATCITNNIWMHFPKRLLKTMVLLNPFPELKKYHLQQLMYCLLTTETDNIVDKYLTWSVSIRDQFLPPIEGSHFYCLKKQPERYLYYSLLMNETIEQHNEAIKYSTVLTDVEKRQQTFRLFQPLSLRHQMRPAYITIDSQVLIDLFCEGKKKVLKGDRDAVWQQIFHIDRRVMRKRGYHLTSIKTDGIGVSISFEREGFSKYGKKPKDNGVEHEHYLDRLSPEDLTRCHGLSVVVGDPGKHDLIRLMNEDGKCLRYTACQRRFESRSGHCWKIMKNKRHREKIEDIEKVLSNVNSKTVDYQRFKEYIKVKRQVTDRVSPFYCQELSRKMRWRVCIARRKSEDLFLNQIEKTYGHPEDLLFCLGDWSQTRMRHMPSTLGVGIRRLIRRRFHTVLVSEYGSSKYCCQCHHELQNYKPVQKGEKKRSKRYRKSKRKKKQKSVVQRPEAERNLPVMSDERRQELTQKLHRVLWCPECQSMSPEGVKTWFFNRDTNACRNLLYLSEEWFRSRTRPDPFKSQKLTGEVSVLKEEEPS